MKRRVKMPGLLRGDPDRSVRIRVALPVWHGGVHEEACTTSESLRYKTGAAMTDGEGVERVWSVMNPLAWATKEMHEDGRHETLEDGIDARSFDKDLGLGELL